MTRLRPALLALVVALTGCAAGRAPLANDTGFPDDTDTEPDTGETGLPPGLEGDWITVTGTLDLLDGQTQPSSALTLDVLLTDAEGTIETVACGATLVAPGQSVEQPPDDVTLFGSWRFDIEPGTCLGLPATVDVGIGPLIPALWPAAEEMGASLKHTRGLYTPNPDGSGLLVFGMAGTTEQIGGTGAPPSLDPLPDGRYHLRSAYLLQL